MTAPRRTVHAATAALILGIVAAAALFVVLLAGRVGPLVAHPPAVAPPSPRPATAPTVPPMTMATPPPRQHEPPSGAWLWWVLAVLAGLILLALAVWLVRALRRPARPAPGARAVAPGVRLEAVLGALTDDPAAALGDERTFDPRRAADDIIASWTAVERAAEIIGPRRPAASTPTEFLGLVVGACGDVAAPSGRSAADELLTLYHRARFDTAVLAPGSAGAARAAARTLVAAMRPADGWAARPPGSTTRPGAHR